MSLDEGIKNVNRSCGDKRALRVTARAILQNVTTGGKFRAPLNCEDKKANQSFCCSPRDAEEKIDDSGGFSDPRTRHFTSELKQTFMGEGSHDNFGSELEMWHKGDINACAQNKCRNKLATYQRLVRNFYESMCNHDIYDMKSRSTRGLLLFHSTGAGKSNSAVSAMMGMWGKTDPNDPRYKLIVLASNTETATVGLDTYVKDAAKSCTHPLMEYARELHCDNFEKLQNCAKVILLLSLPIAWNPNPNRTLGPIIYYIEDEDILDFLLSKQLDEQMLERAQSKLHNSQSLWGQILRDIVTRPSLQSYFFPIDDDDSNASSADTTPKFLKPLKSKFISEQESLFDGTDIKDRSWLRETLTTTNALYECGIDSHVINSLSSGKYGKRENKEGIVFEKAGVKTVKDVHKLRAAWRSLEESDQKKIIQSWYEQSSLRSSSLPGSAARDGGDHVAEVIGWRRYVLSESPPSGTYRPLSEGGDEIAPENRPLPDDTVTGGVQQVGHAGFAKLLHLSLDALYISFDDLYSWISPLGFTDGTEGEKKNPDQATLREYWTDGLPLDKNMMFLIVDEAHTIVQKSSDLNDGSVWNRLYSELNSRDDNPEYRCAGLRGDDITGGESSGFFNNGMIMLLMTATPGDNPCEIVRLLALLHSHHTMLSDITALGQGVVDIPLYQVSHELFLEDSTSTGEIVHMTDRDTRSLQIKRSQYERLSQIIDEYDDAKDNESAELKAKEFVAVRKGFLESSDGDDKYDEIRKRSMRAKLTYDSGTGETEGAFCQRKLKRYRKSKSAIKTANNTLLFYSQKLLHIAPLAVSSAILELDGVLSMQTMFSLINGIEPDLLTKRKIVGHFLDEDDLRTDDEINALFKEVPELGDKKERGPRYEFSKFLNLLLECKKHKYKKLSVRVGKGELDHFFISDQTTLMYDKKNISRVQYFVRTDTRVNLKDGGVLFGDFCKGLISHIDASTDGTKFVRYIHNHEMSRLRKNPDPFHVQVIATSPPTLHDKPILDLDRNHIRDLIFACDRGSSKYLRRGNQKLVTKYNNLKKALEQIDNVREASKGQPNIPDFPDNELIQKSKKTGMMGLKKGKIKFIMNDMDDFNSKDLPFFGRTYLSSKSSITPDELEKYSPKIHRLWSTLVGTPHEPLSGQFDAKSLSVENARHFVHFPYVLEQEDYKFLMRLIDNTKREDQDNPPLRCWSPGQSPGDTPTLPKNCRWVSLMLTVRDAEPPPRAFIEEFPDKDFAAFYSRMSLNAFNSGTTQPWNLEGTVNCASVESASLQSWAALVTDGQKHKAFDVCQGNFAHFVSPPNKLSAARQAQGRLTRYCSHAKTDKSKWKAALIVYFHVDKYMPDRQHLSTQGASSDDIFEQKKQIQALESLRKQNSKEYSIYYNSLEPNAQQKMYKIMQRSAIDCAIFSHLFPDMSQSPCLHYSATHADDKNVQVATNLLHLWHKGFR